MSAEKASSPVTNIYILRSAEQLQSPHVITYRVAEWTQLRGKWLFPDIGYYDTGYGKEQIWFTGAGAELVQRKRFNWEQEIYISQEAGPQSHNRRSLWLWPVLNFQFNPRFSAQVAAYPSIPLDRAQAWSYNIDRAKFQWAFRSHWMAGPGYTGGLCNDRSWQSNPFLTVTRTTPLGNVEVWLQRIPGGSQLQLRYVLVKREK
ncbi:MAG TPA: hypothetical protein VGG85_06665 [Terracidiphilus sp.]|jgi:hypothetical protein